eukprot:TRINITY_DN899_c1_g1_i1.p1 TRINITY_DN899_c1_g1~~TRINITY_DN899_c1_g1_i1.p1  ORF type:complete len:519 (+),score=111.11 TRINITY_DN899_c1_g1_i1:1036-2592(+)
MDGLLDDLERHLPVCEYGKLEEIREKLGILRDEYDVEYPGSDVALKGCGLSILELSVQNELNDVVNMILNEKWGRVDRCVGFPCTVLCKTCYKNPDNVGLVKILLYFGSDPNATISNDGHSASCLISAVINGRVEIVALLLQHDVNIYYEWRGQNALSMAMDFKRTDVVNMIEEHAMKKAHSARRHRLQKPKPTPEPTETLTTTHHPLTDQPIDFTKTLEKQSILTSSFMSKLSTVDWVYKMSDLDIKAHIGTGGFGTVNKAVLLETGDLVACKCITCRGDDMLSVFKEEVALMAKLRHKNVVLFLGAVLDLPSLCIITELMKCNLSDRLQDRASITWPERLRWSRDISRGMTYLHTRNPYVLHRDLKSLNVLLGDSGEAKLCDFGMAKAKKSTMQDSMLCGSPSWMAPEVLRGESFARASDVYSFSVVLWEILTRQTPWPNQTLPQLVGLVGFSCRLLPLPTPLPEGTPPSFISILENCRAKPDARPPFKNITSAIDDVISEEETKSKKPRTTGIPC